MIRGLPELVLMLLIFYGWQVGINKLSDRFGGGYIDIDPFVAGTVTLGFIFGAYLTETFRGAYLAIPKGQIEAGQAFGLGRVTLIRRIVLPDYLVTPFPALPTTGWSWSKATALVSVIGLDDMMHRAGLASASTRQPFTFYAAIACIYLTITTVSLLTLYLLEKALLARREEGRILMADPFYRTGRWFSAHCRTSCAACRSRCSCW